jgi:hypothetical protein
MLLDATTSISSTTDVTSGSQRLSSERRRMIMSPTVAEKSCKYRCCRGQRQAILSKFCNYFLAADPCAACRLGRDGLACRGFFMRASGMTRSVETDAANWGAKASQDATCRMKVPVEALMTGTPS